jgi:small subunit ribosomal protein S16
MGLKKQPSYRVVITDQRASRDGGFIEIVGYHNPRTEPPTDEIDEARVLYWLSQGAQPTDAVARMLVRLGTMARYDRLTKGEELEALAAEAEAARAAAPAVSPRTRYPSPGPGQSRQKAKAAAKAAAAEQAE